MSGRKNENLKFRKTGNYLVFLDEDDPAAVQKNLAQPCGLEYMSTDDGLTSSEFRTQGSSSLIHFSELGIGLIRGDDRQVALATALVSHIEPEGYMFIPSVPAQVEDDEFCERSEITETWGLQDTGVNRSRFTGSEVKVALLDSGINPSHPAFVSKQLNLRPLRRGEAMVDEHGHGSHCAGILFGDHVGSGQPRFGIAQSAVGHVARVFRDETLEGECGSPDWSILNALNWAISEGCAVVSMSFGRMPLCDRAYSKIYEKVARRALKNGTLLVAAAGNDSDRTEKPIDVQPVHEPANCPSIMAVGGIDTCGRLHYASNGGGSTAASRVDICGPSFSLSAWIEPRRYNHIHGTSVATPFVAGIAALWSEACGVRGKDLWNLVLRKAAPLPKETSKDVGAGLVMAPINSNCGESQ